MTERGKISKQLRLNVYDKYNGHCAYCGCEITLQQMQVDHVHPLAKDGADTFDNMVPACRSCNHYKSIRTIESFRKAIESMPVVLMRDNVTYKIAVRFGVVKPNLTKIRFYFEENEEHEQN